MRRINFSLVLLVSVFLGVLLGFGLGPRAIYLKPFGDIFLNLLFTVAVPLVFFSISAAVMGMTDLKRLGRVLGWMLCVFILTGVVASGCMLMWMRFFPLPNDLIFPLNGIAQPEQVSFGEQLVKTFTVDNFPDLFSRKNMGALILFSLIFGIAANAVGEKAQVVKQFTESGLAVMMKFLALVMLYAPIGLTAYFAYLTANLGPQLTGVYFRIVGSYYPLGLAYFIFAFSFYAFWAGGAEGLKRFWTAIPTPAVTAFATGSSLAAIPVNLRAAGQIGVSKEVREMVIPIGATIHMDGSAISAILKIFVLSHVFNQPLAGWQDYAIAVGVAILSGTVMSGIPGGGFLGEILIVTMYGFPPEALPLIAMVGILVDPLATMINSSGDTVSAMLVSRIIYGKNWLYSNGEKM